ncbi:MAG: hypothetical protein ABIY47_06260 [Opitutaceae bacterium]
MPARRAHPACLRKRRAFVFAVVPASAEGDIPPEAFRQPPAAKPTTWLHSPEA